MDTTIKLAVPVINGSPAERILVITPDHQRFAYWCHGHGINPHAPNVRCVTREYDLHGRSDAWYVLLGFPPGIEGVCMFHILERLKATRGLKNAETTGEES